MKLLVSALELFYTVNLVVILISFSADVAVMSGFFAEKDMQDKRDASALPRCNLLQLTAALYNTLQHSATLSKIRATSQLRCAATHCNSLQDTATRCKK